MSQESDALHIGNIVGILSKAYVYTVGTVVYRDLTMVRIMPQEASDRAIEFPMTPDGSKFAPELGVTIIEVIQTQPSDYYVDFLGVKPGETLEFFTVDGQVAAPSGTVEEVIKSASKDSVKMTDGRTIKFRGVGPPAPIAVVRVTGAVAADAAGPEGPEGPGPGKEEVAAEAQVETRRAEIRALLSSVLPTATVEMVPTAERTYPDSMQREDLFQDLLAEISEKQRTNPRRIRFVEREVDLALALKNKSLMRDEVGRIVGPAPYLLATVQEAVAASEKAVPSAIPIVGAARLLNLDDADSTIQHKDSDVVPRSLATVETESEELAIRYIDGALPETVGRGFYAYTYDLLSRGQGVLQGPMPMEWREDQDVTRTAGLGLSVQGLSAGLSKATDTDAPPVSLAFLVSDVTDRAVRVLTADRRTNLRTGEVSMIGPSDPSKVVGYTVLPPKAALSLRPPTRPGHLPMALLYSAALESDNLPTIAQTLRDLYSSEAGSPLNAWTLDAAAASDTDVATWLQTVLRYAVHPVDSLGPRTPQLLSLLDTLGLGDYDMAPAVADVIWSWTAQAQGIWRNLLVERRKVIQAALDTEAPRAFQSVTDSLDGARAPLWPALKVADSLKELLEDIGRRNPTIADAPTLMTAALLSEAQGDAAPLVWAEIAKLDSREFGLDPVASAAALTASRAYALKRKALRDLHIASLSGAPEVNTCPHAARLEAIRNVTDVLSRSRLLRDFIEEYQGPQNGDWMTCVLCKKDCVCYHELMELEALAQPARMDTIQKQILIRFGGERYEGKLVCRNCGQALQDIDYDEHVEFDDNGRPIQNASVLTEEQMEEPTETAWKKATADLAPAPVVFATQSQRDIGDALQLMTQRGGLNVTPDIVRQIVRQADLYVSLRAPPADLYEKQRTRMLTSASTKIKTATGIAGTAVDVPTYAAVLDQLRVSALIALTAIALQSAEPPIVVNNPFPLCRLSRGGYPFNPTAKPEDDGALLYMACVVASIDRDAVPWRSLTWAGETKLESRRSKALKVGFTAVQIILGADPKSAPLSFTPEVRMALSKAQTDVVAQKAKTLVSHGDSLPAGFRPDPFPPTIGRPSVEKDPVPAVVGAIETGESVGPMIASVAHAMRQQGIAVVGELHAAATDAVAGAIALGAPQKLDSVCCPVGFRDASLLQGVPEQLQLLKARNMLRGAIPTAVNAGTHLWPALETQAQVPVEQEVDAGVFFKLFLKYCYRGAQVGEGHEFSVGNSCRQCGLALGKPVDTIDFGKEGAALLAAQQGDLRIEVTQVAFQALSEAVRRRRIMVPVVHAGRSSWLSGIRAVAAVCRKESEFKQILGETMTALEEVKGPLDEVEHATLWAPISAYMGQLRTEIMDRISGGAGTKSTTAMTIFDTLTEDPFIEGPQAVQEYWCAKVQSAGAKYTVTKVTGAVWAALSAKHNDMMNKLVSGNYLWWVMDDTTEGMQPIFLSIAKTIGPLMRTWIQRVRPGPSGSVWSVPEAQMVLRTLVLESWRDALTTSSWMYQTVASPTDREATVARMSAWTRGLMIHAKQQFVKFSKETIKRVLQDRAGLERDTIVEEFESIKDDDVRAAELLKKQFRIGRWGQGANLQKYDADTFEFENEQRKRMGIVDPPVDPILLGPGALQQGQQDYGFALGTGEPEDGYDVGQGADGDDY